MLDRAGLGGRELRNACVEGLDVLGALHELPERDDFVHARTRVARFAVHEVHDVEQHRTPLVRTFRLPSVAKPVTDHFVISVNDLAFLRQVGLADGAASGVAREHDLLPHLRVLLVDLDEPAQVPPQRLEQVLRRVTAQHLGGHVHRADSRDVVPADVRHLFRYRQLALKERLVETCLETRRQTPFTSSWISATSHDRIGLVGTRISPLSITHSPSKEPCTAPRLTLVTAQW